MPRRSTIQPRDEGQLLLTVIANGLPLVIDGKEAITSMKTGGSLHWRQMEWIGFYPEYWFETNVAAGLNAQRGPTFGNMSFDFRREHVWDLKAHAEGKSTWAPLNDIEAVEGCIADFGGVGFLVMSGPCTYDDERGTFKNWHVSLSGGPSDYSRRIAARGAKSRRRKTSFSPDHFLAFWFSSMDDVVRARREGWIKGFQTDMRNSNDVPRRSKIQVDLANIGDWALIHEIRR